VVAGNPGKIIKEVSEEMLQWKTEGTRLYQQLPAEMKSHWVACEPLREILKEFPAQEQLYKPWKKIK
jgi:phenylacetic acid degradation protein